ncbi:hypothetical protein RIF29_38560 [Crotalaria pallida]|uniref:Uncharacterized protein n=1 Tax=Crotalaria pallida TaxID=3830 RepID=A0AAN9HNV9_CROPI
MSIPREFFLLNSYANFFSPCYFYCMCCLKNVIVILSWLYYYQQRVLDVPKDTTSRSSTIVNLLINGWDSSMEQLPIETVHFSKGFNLPHPRTGSTV